MIKLYLADSAKTSEHDDALKLAAYALCDTFGWEVPILKDVHGKPYVREDGIYISIAHSQERCLVAVSNSEIGVDIEYRAPGEERLIRIADRYFTEKEAEYVKANPSERFYEIWCAKESYIKYTGEGLTRPLSSFCVFDSPLIFSHFDIDGYTLCVCSAEKTDTPPIYVKQTQKQRTE